MHVNKGNINRRATSTFLWPIQVTRSFCIRKVGNRDNLAVDRPEGNSETNQRTSCNERDPTHATMFTFNGKISIL